MCRMTPKPWLINQPGLFRIDGEGMKKNKFNYIELAANAKHLRLPGHKLIIGSSGDQGKSGSITGCCGSENGSHSWIKTASSKSEVQREYKLHLAQMIYQTEMSKLAREMGYSDFDVQASDDDWGLLRIRCNLDKLNVGEKMILSPYHWIVRKARGSFVATFINLVGGPVSKRFSQLDSAYLQVTFDNNEMLKQGRVGG